MDFGFTPEQRQLEETVVRFIARDYGFEKRRAIKATPTGWSREVWQQLADLGLLALNVPEDHGGLNGDPVDTLLVMNALAAGLLLEPYLSSAVIATRLITELASPTQQSTLLPALAAGDKIAVLAHFEPASRYAVEHVYTRAAVSGDGYVLQGHKAVVQDADAADFLLVSARIGDADADDVHGSSLFLVPRETPGVRLRVYPTLDGRRAAEVLLDSVYLPATARMGMAGSAAPAIERALDVGLAALCAEAVGVMKALLDATVEYLKTRQQFGQPIGRFQALQHRCADMLIAYEQAKSMSYLAALRCTVADPIERRRALSAAKVTIGQASRLIGQQAVQLHGGMGMTDELKVSHWFKRLIVIELSLGDTDSHLQRYADLLTA
jgi:alkylation response protein AidB-like acyl-CoA dehydrogenase